MKRKALSVASALTAVAIFAAAFAGTVGAKTNRTLAFEVLTPVVAPYTGSLNPIRGINGGGVPWSLHEARGSLTTGGALKVEVSGLVVASTGSNPVGAMKAIVSCQDPNGGVTNVSTATFPATTGLASAGGGNVDIEAQVSLPHPCIAPIVFVATGGGAWLATTGF
jgi:hypothetical protein